jgi:ATP-dependent RNA helicase DDX46/PRP5
MTSEERRQEEERERQARLARARMLALLEKDEDEEVKEEPETKKVKGESTLDNSRAVQVSSVVQPSETKESVSSTGLVPERAVQLSNPMEELKANYQPDEPIKIDFPANINQSKDDRVDEEEDKKMEVNTDEPMAVNSEEKKEEVEQRSALIEENKEFTQVGVNNEFRKEPPIEQSVSEEEPLPEYIKQKKQLDDNEIDPLDAFMAEVIRNPNINLIEESNEAVKEAEAKTGITPQAVTLEEINEMAQDSPNNSAIQEIDEERYHNDFVSKLKQIGTGSEETSTKKADTPTNNQEAVRIYNDDDDAYLQELEKDYENDDFVSRQKRQAQKKELKPVNHEEIDYEPFRKNFYIEVPEINRMTEGEVEEFRRELGGIKIRGQNCPKPVQNWYQCGLSDKVLEIIERKGFKTMFPVQNQAIPAIMSGKDVIAIAETGSGKTLAYVLPMLRHVMDRPFSREGEGPIALVIAPTRELATQIYMDIKMFTRTLGLRVVCVYGGAGVTNQLSELKRGCEIVVCTPGRMIDVLTTSNGKITNLKRVTYVIMDEADRLLDLGFEPQISRLLANIRPERQVIMCSATFPKQIENLAKKALQKPIEIVVGNRGQACKNVDQLVEVREEDTKFKRLLEILGEWANRGSILIFVEKKEEADTLFKDLFTMGYKVLVLHRGQDQTDRENTILDFKRGVRNIMVATSVASRGLDIKNIALVINYSPPNHAEDYVHRVGRTGRAGHKGMAITFITSEECQYAGEIIKALKLSRKEVPEQLEELDRLYRQKVDKGEIERYKPKGFVGSGYKFSQEEQNRIKAIRKQLSSSYGIDMEASDSEDEIDVVDIDKRKKKDEEEKTRDQLITERIKDPRVKQAAMDAAISAAKIAIANGSDLDGAKRAAELAIKKIAEEYKPTVSLREGLEKVLQMRDEFEAQEDRKNNRVSADFEINDYPQAAKNKVADRDFASRIYEGTGCTISVRGINVDINRNPTSGQRRLHVHIEGETRQDVQNAYQEIKRFMEDEASASIGGYMGSGERYTIP